MKFCTSSLLTLLLIGMLTTGAVVAQAPEGFLYQAEARNSSGYPIRKTELAVRITIRSGDPGGIVVWEGEHEVTTNKYGLFSLVVGEGTGGAYDFKDINWAAGTYFLNVMIYDCCKWVDMGTSQLLSVPYALHAKTVEKITETDPVFSASQAANITETDITNLGNLSGINTGDQDLSRLASQAALADTASAIRSAIPGVTLYNVGDLAQGGIVFWVDQTGQHGLVCEKKDQATRAGWYAGKMILTQAKGDGLFAGKSNTVIIIAAQAVAGDDNNPYAARLCNEFRIRQGGNTYGDWYLPSREELNLMYLNKKAIDATAMANAGTAFAREFYWSSTEIGRSGAWIQNFETGYQGGSNKSNSVRVRAIRSF
jgi:hypothetical protein